MDLTRMHIFGNQDLYSRSVVGFYSSSQVTLGRQHDVIFKSYLKTNDAM